MPEALAIVLVLLVAAGTYVFAWLRARDPANHNAERERIRLEHHQASLQQRLEVARRENWGDEMVAQLSSQVDAVAAQLARSGSGGSRATRAV